MNSHSVFKDQPKPKQIEKQEGMILPDKYLMNLRETRNEYIENIPLIRKQLARDNVQFGLMNTISEELDSQEKQFETKNVKGSNMDQQFNDYRYNLKEFIQLEKQRNFMERRKMTLTKVQRDQYKVCFGPNKSNSPHRMDWMNQVDKWAR